MQGDRSRGIAGRILMRFPDIALEAAYRDHLFDSNRSLVTLSLALAAVLFAVAEPLARMFFPSDAVALDSAIRWYLNLPAVLLALVMHLAARKSGHRELALQACLGSVFVGNAVLLWSVPPSGQLYYAVASAQIALFGFFLLGLRFRTVFLVVLACFAVPAAAAIARALSDNPQALLQSAYAAALLIVAGLAFAAFTLDRSRRELFLANLERDEEHAQRLVLEEQRSRWLKVGSDYLNHEMKNALLGISSSLSLLQQRNREPTVTDYIDRASSSARFMKRLLAEVSASTSLESALDQIESEVIDLAELVGDRLDEYRAMHPDNTFTAELAAQVQISCDVERLIQALDKLVDNAVQHSAGDHPIDLGLSVMNGTAVLSVANRGDSLANTEGEMFQAHVSGKQRTSDSGYGFGLYIVRRIAEAHGGNITATALTNPDGAQFNLQLPLHAP